MKFTAQEEFGLRCLLCLARRAPEGSATIDELAASEGLSSPNVAKLMRVLRQAGFVESIRGKHGGYRLTRPATEIVLSDVLAALGGRLYTPQLCARYCGEVRCCVHIDDCAIRALWAGLDGLVNTYLARCRLADLMGSEARTRKHLAQHATMPAPARSKSRTRQQPPEPMLAQLPPRPLPR
jgi:Rrf2 family protein